MEIKFINKWYDMPIGKRFMYSHYKYKDLKAYIFCKTNCINKDNKYHKQKCIYLLEINNCIYVGRTNNFRKRIIFHLKQIKSVIIHNKCTFKNHILNKNIQHCHLHIGNLLSSVGGSINIKVLSFDDSYTNESHFINIFSSNKKYLILNVVK